MLDTRLILIEGLPGAGKSTTARRLGELLRQRGFSCHSYREEDDPHPIPILDFALSRLSQVLPPIWEAFVQQAAPDSTITIIESRLWQNTCLYMHMSNYDLQAILALQRQLLPVLAPLAPALLVLHQQDVEAALRRIYDLRGATWMEREMAETTQYPWFQSRGLDGFDGWVQFFSEWMLIAGLLYDEWPFAKIKIHNPHADWEYAYHQMAGFLQLEPAA